MAHGIGMRLTSCCFWLGLPWPGQQGVHGTVRSPLRGEMRLQSDHLLARDPRSACEWQALTNDQAKLQGQFAGVFDRLAVVGVDANTLIDRSDIIPQPLPLPITSLPHFLAGKTHADVEQAVRVPKTLELDA